MQPTTTTTTTEMWQWQCGTCRADCKMLRQVTATCCPMHGDGGRGRCCQGHGTPPPPGAGNPAPHCHHHHHHHHGQEGTTTGSGRALAASAEGSNSNAGPGRQTITITTPNLVVAEVVGCWVPDPYLMVQQLREFEPLNDELVALRVQLQEYAEKIHKSSNAGMNLNWLLALPANVRDVVILARDVIESFIAISTTAPPPN